MSDVVVRPVRVEDAAELQANCFPRSELDEVRARLEQNLAEARANRYVHLVAEDDGHVVGTIELSANPGGKRAHRGELRRFVVAESHRGRGIARALLNATRAEAAARDIE